MWLALAVAFIPVFLYGQTPAVDITLKIVNDAGDSDTLHFGIDPAATSGIDAALGEKELPPLPFTEIFDARFIGTGLGEGVLKDFREGTIAAGGTTVHRLKYQKGGGLVVTISWDLPDGVTGRLNDIILGTLIDVAMNGTGSYTVTNPDGFNQLDMTVQYAAGLPIELSRFVATVMPNGQVRLDWTTVTETNNYGFEIQKAPGSPNGFSTIPNSFVAGNGTTVQEHLYFYVDEGSGSGVWFYRLKQIDLDGTVHYPLPIRMDIVLSVDKKPPESFGLMRNFPNPFNPGTTITFDLPDESVVSLTVYSVLGERICTLLESRQVGGAHSIWWSGERESGGMTAAGVYFCRLEGRPVQGGPGFAQTIRLNFVK
jgi:hypothetical protein